jgi:two-component system, NtrC family, response regulator HydG
MVRQTNTSSDWVTTCSRGPEWLSRDENSSETESLCLTIVWSAAEPGRIGEVGLVDESVGDVILGRGGPTASDQAERLRFFRQRPGSLQPTAPLKGGGISRRQCIFRSKRDWFEVERVGSCPVLLDGVAIERGTLMPGQVLTLKDHLVLICVRRTSMPKSRHSDASQSGPFGSSDRLGIVGESPAIWELREQLAFCAASDKHVLVLGESGSGKELAARAIHRLSSRSDRPLVARNAATFPATLIDAELFGNAPNYPNAGMPARPGVIGEAHRSTLFLDEIAELPRELQAHLLRVMDQAGEYQQLGDAHVHRSDFRLIAATNRDPTELRLDLLARLTLQVQLPSLEDRPEDIPLLVRHLLVEAAKSTPALRARFFDESAGELVPRVDPDLIEALLRQKYRYNVRELDGLLWQAVAASNGNYVALPRAMRSECSPAPRPQAASGPVTTRPVELDPHTIMQCLNRHGGHVARAAEDLGVASRYALYRLMKKHGIQVERAK